MTKKAWCIANNINEKQFFYWQSRVRMQLVQELEPTSTLTPKPMASDRIPAHLVRSNPDAVLHIKDFTLEINNLLSPELLGLLIQSVTHA
nr:hypothetical protein [Cellulosilyticum ruminicola]